MHEWIKLHRSLRDSDVYQDPAAKVVFLHLLLIADGEGKGRIGRFNAAVELRMKPSTFYGALQRCVSEYQILQLETNNKVTAFSILNWDKYQTITNNKPTANRQQTDSRPTLYKEEIKNKSKKENIKEILGRDVAEHLISVFNQATGKKYTLTDKRRKLINERRKSFPSDQLENAAKNIALSPFHMGKNDRNWMADPDWLFRNDENVDKMLNLEIKQVKTEPVRLGYKAQTERKYAPIE